MAVAHQRTWKTYTDFPLGPTCWGQTRCLLQSIACCQDVAGLVANDAVMDEETESKYYRSDGTFSFQLNENSRILDGNIEIIFSDTYLLFKGFIGFHHSKQNTNNVGCIQTHSF